MSIEYSETLYNRDIIRFQKAAVTHDTWHSCVNCQHWDKNLCQLYKAIPPMDVIVSSCEAWNKQIPF